jgi:hypothetical protein
MKFSLFAFALLVAALAPLRANNSADAAVVPSPAPTVAKPIWAKLVLAGNSVTCFYATGTAAPTTWTQVGKPTTVNFVNSPLLVGLFLCSHDATALSTGTIDNFSITPAPTYRLADVDIGSPALMGSANLISGVWTLTGSGADIWDTSDQFNFQPWLVWGDCTVVARITGLSAGQAWQKIGITIRDGYNSGSDYASFVATNGNGICFQYRSNFTNNNDITQLVAAPSPGIMSSVSIGYSTSGATSYVLRP